MLNQACESCGREFSCGADEERCWCNEVELTPDRRAILREHFERCLCPDCLAVAGRQTGGQTPLGKRSETPGQNGPTT